MISNGILISMALLLTACNQSTESDSVEAVNESEQATTVSEADIATDNNEEGLVNKGATAAYAESTVTFLTLTAGNPIVKGDQETIECYTGADHTYAISKLQELYETNLTEDELNTANEFFSSDVGRRATAYNQQIPLKTLGAEIDNEVVLTEDDRAALNEFFLETEVGRKTGKLMTLSQDNTELLETVMNPILAKEQARCNVFLSDDLATDIGQANTDVKIINQSRQTELFKKPYHQRDGRVFYYLF